VLGEVGKGCKIAIEALNEGRIGIVAQMIVCLRQPSLKKAKTAPSLSPPSVAARRIGAVANNESSGPQFD